MTDEQPDPYDVAAGKIDDAIRELLEATEDAPAFLTDWLLVAAAHIDDADGDSMTGYRRVVRAEQPPHATLGLLEYEVTRLRHYLNHDGQVDPP